jgi:WD40 repeat protein
MMFWIFNCKLSLKIRVNDNSCFASCGNDKKVYLWDISSGSIIRNFYSHIGRVNCVILIFNFNKAKIQ